MAGSSGPGLPGRPAPPADDQGQIIWPAVMGVAFLGMMAMVLTQPGLRSGPMGLFSLFDADHDVEFVRGDVHGGPF